MHLWERLNNARNGSTILFCGAGFTADSLNFSESEVGAGAQLLSLFNSELERLGQTNGYRDIRNAAEKYEDLVGEKGTMDLLKNRYTLKNVSDDIVAILKYPWTKIYTTNYDNGIEYGLSRNGSGHTPVNNTEDPEDSYPKLPVIHLHGFAEKWDIRNFKSSCILGMGSYLGLPGVANWLKQFRDDVERADLVVFAGFNAGDFHLNQAIFDLSSLKKKIVFINRPAAQPDPDVSATQARFGEPLFIGRQGLSQAVAAALSKAPPKQPATASFQRYAAPPPSPGVPPVDDIQDLFLFGRLDRNHLARDISDKKSDYHVNRRHSRWIDPTSFDDGCVNLIIGEICEGKTILVEELCQSLSTTRPIFVLRHAYDNLLDEFADISAANGDAAFVIENCFDLRGERLLAIARMCESSGHTLIMTARNIAVEAEGARLEELSKLTSFQRLDIPPLSDDEADALINLADQIAAWRTFAGSTHEHKKRYVQGTCNGRLQSFLLDLLKSDYVKNKYIEEYNKISFLSVGEKKAILTALYICHVGHDAPVRFLSNALEFDVGDAIDRLNAPGQENKIKLVFRLGSVLRTVPAIGATNILKNMVSDRDIVDSIVDTMNYLAEQPSLDDLEDHLYRQMMRYSILRGVVSDENQIDRFFDNISKIRFYRQKSLFWLQWHMAKADFDKYVDAERYLDQGYKEADNYESRTGRKYNRNQLDDQKAKFLMKRARNVARDIGGLFRDFSDALDVVEKLLQLSDVTHHPFDTLKAICESYGALRGRLLGNQQQVCDQRLQALTARAQTRLPTVAPGYQRSAAQRAFEYCAAFVKT